MTPYADVIHRRHFFDAETDKYIGCASAGPEPQQCHVDFRSGQTVSEVAAQMVLAMLSGMAKWGGPARYTDFRAEVDPENPDVLKCSYKVCRPEPFIYISFVIDPPEIARACECGSEKTGLPTHSSWCPKGKP